MPSRVHWMATLAVATATLLLGVSSASAKDKSAEALVSCESLVEAGSHAEAAAALAKLIHRAHKRREIRTEISAANLLDRILRSSVPADAADGVVVKEAKRRQALLAALLEGIDKKHRGCIVSAQMLARVLLCEAVMTRDDVGVKAAVAVMKSHRKDERSGIAREALALFALGVQAGLEKKDAKSIKALRKSLSIASENRWLHVAVSACAMLVPAYLRAEKHDDAAKAVTELSRCLEASMHPQAITRWHQLVRVGWAGGSSDLRAPVQALWASAKSAMEKPPSGGGVPGRRSEAEHAELRKSWERTGAKFAFGVVRRQDVTMMGSVTLGKGRVEQFRPFDGAVRCVDFNGLLLIYRMNAAGLRGIDLPGKTAVPAGRHFESGAYALYLLAPGEYVKFTLSGAYQLGG